MSLLQKHSSSEKELALELAVLISIADNELNYYSNNGTKLYFDHYFNANKRNVLNLYLEELDIERKNLDKILNSYDNNLSKSITRAVDIVFSKYRDDRNIQKETLMLIEKLGVSIISTSPAAINKCMTYIPMIKEEILCVALKGILDKRDLKLSEKDKKTFLFELIYLSLLYGNYESIIFILRKLCDLFSIDFEYIDEFKDMAKEYYFARNKLNSINENIRELIEE